MSRRRRTSRPATTRRRKRPARAKIPGRRRRIPRTTAARRTPAAVTRRRPPSAAPAPPIRSSKAWTPTAPRIPLTRPPIGPACERRASDRHGLPDQARKRQEPAGVPVEGTPSDGGGARRRRALAESSPHFRTYEARDYQVAGLFCCPSITEEETHMISGVWLPIVTPFVDGAVDFAGYERLLEHYLGKGVSGVFPLGTTGESPTIDDDEMEALVERTVGVVAGRVPVFVGVGGNATRKVLATLKRLERHRFEGIVSVCPYYNRPSQDGMREHFTRIAEATDRQILVYNIPYRTSVNLANDT